MSERFIKLHALRDNAPVVLREAILLAAVKKERGTTVSYADGDDMSSEVDVNESPEKIFSMMEVPFIKLHTRSNNAVACIAVSNIKLITQSDRGNTQVETMDIELSVNESPERIHNMLKRLDTKELKRE